MKKWKDVPRNEKWMMVIIVLLLIAVLIRWNYTKEQIGRGFHWFRSDEIPVDSLELDLTIPRDTFPVEQPDREVIIIE